MIKFGTPWNNYPSHETVPLTQWCGSGSAWIGIDPHWFGCLGSRSVLGMRILIWIQEHGNLQKLTYTPGLLPFKKAFVPSSVCFLSITGTYFLYIFHVKIQLFVTLTSDRDPDLDPRGFALVCSVAEPGCLCRIPDPWSWFLPIPDPGSKNSKKREGWKKICCPNFLCSHKFHKIENYFCFEVLKKKNWANFQRIIELFTQKIVIKLSKIWVWDPGSGKTYSGSRIQGSKRHRIPDPDPQHCWFGYLELYWDKRWIRISIETHAEFRIQSTALNTFGSIRNLRIISRSYCRCPRRKDL